jgi:hypothetical protein
LFEVSGSERMRIDTSGNVGIGTSSPGTRLHVYGGAVTNPTNFYSEGYIADGTVDTRCGTIRNAFDSNASFGTYWTSFRGANGNLYRSILGVRTSNSDTDVLFIDGSGEVKVNTATDNGPYNLQCNGTGVWGAGAYVNGSDERIKDDIEPLASGLDVVEKLNPVTYRYKENWTKDQSVQTGFIAQELLTALDGQVYVDGVVQQGGSEGYYSVAYQNIIPILTKAIQELKAELDTVKAELATLKGQA